MAGREKSAIVSISYEGTGVWFKVTCHQVHMYLKPNCFTRSQPQLPVPKKLGSKTHRIGKGLLRSSSLVCSFSDKETEFQKYDLLTVTG